MNTPQKAAIIVLVIGLFAVFVASRPPEKAADIQAGTFNTTGAGTYLLQNSITQSQTSITLSAATPFTEPSSNIPYTMTYLNTNIVYGTISPANGTSQTDNSEFISFTGITQNTNGSATLTGVTRGLARSPGAVGCTASTTLAHAYPSQTKFILSNSPCFYTQFAVKQNSETIGGLWSFSSTSPPKLDYDPTAAQWAAFSSSTLVTYHLLQTTALAGATNASITAKGIVQLASSTKAASSTNVGAESGAFNALSAGYATDTPQNCTGLKSGGCVVMSNLLAKISQAWLDLTANFTVSGIWNFTNNVGISTSTPYAPLSVVGAKGVVADMFTATSTVSTSTLPYLKITNNATTTNLWVSGTCTNCVHPTIVNSTSGACATTAASTCTVTATCTGSQIVVGGGIQSSDSTSAAYATASYPSATNAWTGILTVIASGGTSAHTVTAYAICVNP